MKRGLECKDLFEAGGLGRLPQPPDHLDSPKLLNILWREWDRRMLELRPPLDQAMRRQPFSYALSVPSRCIQIQESSRKCMDTFMQ